MSEKATTRTSVECTGSEAAVLDGTFHVSKIIVANNTGTNSLVVLSDNVTGDTRPIYIAVGANSTEETAPDFVCDKGLKLSDDGGTVSVPGNGVYVTIFHGPDGY